MREIDIADAAASLSRIVDDIALGEEVVLTRDGRAVATLRGTPRKQAIRLGICQGLWSVPDNFDDPLPDDVLDLFYEGSMFPNVSDDKPDIPKSGS